MLTATVSFDVELTEEEAKILELLQRGVQIDVIAAKALKGVRVPLKELNTILDGIKLDEPLDLVRSTQQRKISWEFHHYNNQVRKMA